MGIPLDNPGRSPPVVVSDKTAAAWMQRERWIDGTTPVVLGVVVFDTAMAASRVLRANAPVLCRKERGEKRAEQETVEPGRLAGEGVG